MWYVDELAEKKKLKEILQKLRNSFWTQFRLICISEETCCSCGTSASLKKSYSEVRTCVAHSSSTITRLKWLLSWLKGFSEKFRMNIRFWYSTYYRSVGPCSTHIQIHCSVLFSAVVQTAHFIHEKVCGKKSQLIKTNWRFHWLWTFSSASLCWISSSLIVHALWEINEIANDFYWHAKMRRNFTKSKSISFNVHKFSRFFFFRSDIKPWDLFFSWPSYSNRLTLAKHIKWNIFLKFLNNKEKKKTHKIWSCLKSHISMH